jgi:hypothetical protein
MEHDHILMFVCQIYRECTYNHDGSALKIEASLRVKADVTTSSWLSQQISGEIVILSSVAGDWYTSVLLNPTEAAADVCARHFLPTGVGLHCTLIR